MNSEVPSQSSHHGFHGSHGCRNRTDLRCGATASGLAKRNTSQLDFRLLFRPVADRRFSFQLGWKLHPWSKKISAPSRLRRSRDQTQTILQEATEDTEKMNSEVPSQFIHHHKDTETQRPNTGERIGIRPLCLCAFVVNPPVQPRERLGLAR